LLVRDSYLAHTAGRIPILPTSGSVAGSEAHTRY
jgi:hypothetical protein